MRVVIRFIIDVHPYNPIVVWVFGFFKINPESFQEGRHDQENEVFVSDGREGEMELEKYNPADHIPDSLEIEPKEVEKAKEKAVKTTKPKRARTAKGRYKADDKSTPDVNEAWESGKAPKKKK